MARNLILEVAERRVTQYADQSVDLMRGRTDATEDCDCEDYLKRGIEALRWLRNAEEMLREADAQGISPLSPEATRAMNTLYRAWLTACDRGKKWVGELRTRGFVIGNAAEFEEACEEVEEIVERTEWQEKAARTRLANSAQEDW